MGSALIRRAVLAGSWYPGDPDVLRADVSKYLQSAGGASIDGTIFGLLAPHAGYVYSGGVAAHAYKAVQGRTFDAVMIIAPSHREFFRGVSVYPEGVYVTPLGEVPVDAGLAETIVGQCRHASFLPAAHAAEHAIEIQLPFLQMVLGEFWLIPILMGDQTAEICVSLADAIIKAIGNKRVLVIASSDLSHYHPYERAVQMDQSILKHVAAMDPEGLLRELQTGHAEACGGGPAATMMMVARGLGAKRAEILKYANSGDITADRSGVVGYAAAAFYE